MSLHIIDKNNFIVDKESERNNLWHEGLTVYIRETNKTYIVRNRGFVLISDKGDKGNKGDKGDKGNKGDSIKGDMGIQGLKGDRGTNGYTPRKGVDYFDGITTIIYTTATGTG